MNGRRHIYLKWCKILSRFFFDHRGAKRKAHLAPQSCKKNAPEKKNFAAPPKKAGENFTYTLVRADFLRSAYDPERNFPKGHIKLWISQKK